MNTNEEPQFPKSATATRTMQAALVVECRHPACENMAKVWTVDCEANVVPQSLLKALRRTGLAFTPCPRESECIRSTVVVRYNCERDGDLMDAREARDVIEKTIQGDIRTDCKAQPTIADTLWEACFRDEATQRFLETHVVLDADKNMGACITTRKWFDAAQRQFLKDTRAFPRIGRLDRETGTWVAWIPQGNPHIIPVATTGTRTAICNELIEQYKRYFFYLHEKAGGEKHAARKLWAFIEPRIHEREFGAMRGMPKVHKTPCKFRPVVNQRDVLTSRASKAVDKLLRRLIHLVAEHEQLGDYGDVIDANIPRNRERLSKARQELIRRGYSAQTLQFISADYEAMYTQIKIERAIEAIAETAARLSMSATDTLTATIESRLPGELDPFTGQTLPGARRTEEITTTIGELQLLTKAVMRYSPFVVDTQENTELVLQLDGVIMGVNLAPSLADVTALEAKLKLIDLQTIQDTHGRHAMELELRCAALQVPCPTPFESRAELKHTLRQIDDVAMLATPSFLAQRGRQWITHFYQGPALGLNLEWTDPEPDGWTPWLDTRQRINPTTGELEQRMYSKPGNTFTYPHGEGCVPAGQRKGILLGGLDRIERIATSVADKHKEVNALIARLRFLQYDAQEMRLWVRQAITKRENNAWRETDPNTGLATAMHRQCTVTGETPRAQRKQRRVVVMYHPNLDTHTINTALRQRDETTDGIAWRARPKLNLPHPRAAPGAKRSRPRGGRLLAEARARELI